MPEGSGRLDDAELWRCIEVTVRDILLPVIPDEAEWARAAAVQLVGLARYAQRRAGPEVETQRRSERVAALRALADNPYVAARWNAALEPDDIDTVIGLILVDALGRSDADAQAVHEQLRALLVRQLDDELHDTGPLVQAFRGRLDA